MPMGELAASRPNFEAIDVGVGEVEGQAGPVWHLKSGRPWSLRGGRTNTDCIFRAVGMWEGARKSRQFGS